jgi:hypothetical protein
VFAVARSHTFAALADAIDAALARWDRSHLRLFELVDATDVCGPIPWEDPPEGSLSPSRATSSAVGEMRGSAAWRRASGCSTRSTWATTGRI